MISGKNSSGVVWDYDGGKFTSRLNGAHQLSEEDLDEAKFLLELRGTEQYKKSMARVVRDSILEFFDEFNIFIDSDEYVQVEVEGGTPKELEIILDSHYEDYLEFIGNVLTEDSFFDVVNKHSAFCIFYKRLCDDPFLKDKRPFLLFCDAFEDFYNYCIAYMNVYFDDWTIDDYINFIANWYKNEDYELPFDTEVFLKELV